MELARSVYKLNDKRFKLKNKINKLTHSELREEKLYSWKYRKIFLRGPS